MPRTGKIILAVVAGAALWAVLWLGGNRVTQAMWPTLVVAEQPITHRGVLLFYIAYACALSVLAGFVTATVAGTGARIAVAILAALQLLFGIMAEVSYWHLAPAWYHIVFLALIVPTTLLGGRLRQRSGTAALARA